MTKSSSCTECNCNTYYLVNGRCPTCAYENSPEFEARSANMLIENELRASRKSKSYIVGTWTNDEGTVTTRMGICEEPYIYRTKSQRRGWELPPPIDQTKKIVTASSMRKANRNGTFFHQSFRVKPKFAFTAPLQKPEPFTAKTEIVF